MRIALLDHPTIAKDCVEALKELGHAPFLLDPNTPLIPQIARQHPDLLFSVNTHQDLLDSSYCLDIPSIGWVVDHPHYNLHRIGDLKQARAPTLFHFDRELAAHHGLHYLPVAANVSRLSRYAHPNPQYATDVCFVGSPCAHNEFNQFNLHHLYDPTPLFKQQLLHFDQPILQQQQLPELLPLYDAHMIVARKYTEFERRTILDTMSSRFTCAIWGDAGWQDHPSYRGYAREELPAIYYNAKININLTRCYVPSGLPLRLFEVLGSKGFLLTNDRPDIHRYFEAGEDLVTFCSVDELLDLTDYYLHHEKKRRDIAQAGYEKVCKHHQYLHRLPTLLKNGICTP